MLETRWGKRNLYKLLVAMYISINTMESIRRPLKKVKIELPYDPAILLLGI
jgi:hypothetical protein